MATYGVTVTMVDDQGREGQKRYETQDLASYALAEVAADALCTDLAVVTGMEVLRFVVSGTTVFSDAVTSGANKDAGATLVVRKTDTNRDTLKFPAPIAAVLDGQGGIDIANASVIAYFSNFLAAGDFTFSDGELATDLLSGRLDV